LTEHSDVITPLLRGPRAEVLYWASRLLGPALDMPLSLPVINENAADVAFAKL